MSTISKIAASLMRNSNSNMQVISNNIANVETSGFKSEFATYKTTPGVISDEIDPIDNQKIPDEFGAGLSAIRTNYTQGHFIQTGLDNDYAIDGFGYFVVTDEDGTEYLTRDGRFHYDDEGVLRNVSDHIVSLDTQDTNNLPSQLLLYKVKESDLISEKNGIFSIREGANIISSADNPIEFGDIYTGYLESSNVDLATELSEMIITSQTYDMGAKIFQLSDENDEMINKINN